MPYKATHKFARISPRKAGLIATLIRGRGANDAIVVLENTHKRAAAMMVKVLQSAVANALAEDADIEPDDLVVLDARADEGPRLRRGRPGPRGRWCPRRRRMSHLTVTVGRAGERVQ